MISISCSEMKKMDSYAIEKIGIPSIVLMENAALKVIQNIDLNHIDSFTIIAGVGNNGGDGLAIARHLFLEGKDIDLFIIGDLNNGTVDFNINLNILRNLGVKITNIIDGNNLDKFQKSLLTNDLTIDSIFGIGLTRDVLGLYSEAISLVNQHSKDIISIDLPSGLDGDSGKVLGISVKANKTVTFHLIKKGLLENEKYTGEVIVEDIGIPEIATNAILRD